MNAPIRFDAYASTMLDDLPPMVFLDAIASDLEGAERIVPGLRGQNGYAERAAIVDGDGYALANINFGGNSGARPNIRAQGPATPEFVEVLRSRYPRHRFTRVDACCDLLGADFRGTVDRCRVIAGSNGTHGLRHVPDDPEKGETYEIGSRQSPAFTRVYQKHLELIKKGVDPAEFPEPIVRIEAEVKPKGDGLREAFAHYSPHAVFGASRVTRAISRLLLDNNPAAIVMRRRPPSDYERQCTWLKVQARKALFAIRDRHPTPEEFYSFLFDPETGLLKP